MKAASDLRVREGRSSGGGRACFGDVLRLLLGYSWGVSHVPSPGGDLPPPRVAPAAAAVPARPRCCNAVSSAASGSRLCRCCCPGCWRPARTRFPPWAAWASRSFLYLSSAAQNGFFPFFVPVCVGLNLILEGMLGRDPVVSPRDLSRWFLALGQPEVAVPGRS